MTIMMPAGQTALRDLDERWGEAYDIAITRAGWIAKRLDDGRPLVASGPEGLCELIRADDTAGCCGGGPEVTRPPGPLLTRPARPGGSLS